MKVVEIVRSPTSNTKNVKTSEPKAMLITFMIRGDKAVEYGQCLIGRIDRIDRINCDIFAKQMDHIRDNKAKGSVVVCHSGSDTYEKVINLLKNDQTIKRMNVSSIPYFS